MLCSKKVPFYHSVWFVPSLQLIFFFLDIYFGMGIEMFFYVCVTGTGPGLPASDFPLVLAASWVWCLVASSAWLMQLKATCLLQASSILSQYFFVSHKWLGCPVSVTIVENDHFALNYFSLSSDKSVSSSAVKVCYCYIVRDFFKSFSPYHSCWVFIGSVSFLNTSELFPSTDLSVIFHCCSNLPSFLTCPLLEAVLNGLPRAMGKSLDNVDFKEHSTGSAWAPLDFDFFWQLSDQTKASSHRAPSWGVLWFLGINIRSSNVTSKRQPGSGAVCRLGAGSAGAGCSGLHPAGFWITPRTDCSHSGQPVQVFDHPHSKKKKKKCQVFFFYTCPEVLYGLR